MRVSYRGFEIDVRREKCMAGYKLVYFSVMRKSDSFELICNYSDSADTVRDWVKWMRARVDGFIEDPREEVLPSSFNGRGKDYDRTIARHRKENERTQKSYGQVQH